MGSVSFSDIIAAVALLVSVLALLVSAYALFQAAGYRRRDILIDIAREREPLEDLIRSLWSGVGQLHLDPFSWAFRIKKSSQEEAWELEVGALSREIRALAQQLAEIPKPGKRMGQSGAEQVLATLIAMRVRADALDTSIKMMSARLKESNLRSGPLSLP